MADVRCARLLTYLFGWKQEFNSVRSLPGTCYFWQSHGASPALEERSGSHLLSFPKRCLEGRRETKSPPPTASLALVVYALKLQEVLSRDDLRSFKMTLRLRLQKKNACEGWARETDCAATYYSAAPSQRDWPPPSAALPLLLLSQSLSLALSDTQNQTESSGVCIAVRNCKIVFLSLVSSFVWFSHHWVLARSKQII